MGQNRVPSYFSVRHAPKTTSEIGWVDRFEVSCYFRTYIHTLWAHGEGVDGLCSVVRCAVLLLYQVLSTEWQRRRSPAVARLFARSFDRRQSPAAAHPPPPPSSGLWPPSSLARRRSLAPSPAVVRSPAAALVINIPTYRYYYNTRGLYTCILQYIVESQCMHPQPSSSPALRHSCLALRCGAVWCCAVLSV